MKVNYRKLFLKLSIWLAAEVILSYLGLDNLADYSEYLKEQNATHGVVNRHWIS